MSGGTNQQPGMPTFYRPDGSSISRHNSSSRATSNVATGVTAGDQKNPTNYVGTSIVIYKQNCRIKAKFLCDGEELYALESDIPMMGYDGRCPKCRTEHVEFNNRRAGFYVSVKSIHDKIDSDKLNEERAKGPKPIDKLPIESKNLPPLDHPILGENKGIEGDSNSCYMDSTIFCMFIFSSVFDSLLNMEVDKQHTKNLQTLLRENIVNVLRSDIGFVGRDALFHLRGLLSKATDDQTFIEMEKDPTEFLRALEKLFHYAPLQTISPDQPPTENRSNITTNIMWEMFDANPQNLLSTNIAGIFRNSLAEIPAKLATIPPFLILIAPRHARSKRSYRYIIPDREITLDDKVVQHVCLECHKTNHGSDQLCDFYFCNECYMKNKSPSSTQSIDTNVICYCHGCIERRHKALPKEERVEHHPQQMKTITHKLNLFAVLCIETSHYVAFVKCRKPNQRHEWIFFDSMSDRVHNEKNIPCVSRVPKFDQWIDDAERDKYFFDDLDRRRNQGRPTSHAFSEDDMRQIRLFRDGAFFFYENATVDYQ